MNYGRRVGYISFADIVEKMLEHMLNPSRTRRQVVNQLVNMGIVEDRKMLRKKRRKGERKKKNNNEDGFVVVSQTLGHRRNAIT